MRRSTISRLRGELPVVRSMQLKDGVAERAREKDEDRRRRIGLQSDVVGTIGTSFRARATAKVGGFRARPACDKVSINVEITPCGVPMRAGEARAADPVHVRQLSDRRRAERPREHVGSPRLRDPRRTAGSRRPSGSGWSRRTAPSGCLPACATGWSAKKGVSLRVLYFRPPLPPAQASARCRVMNVTGASTGAHPPRLEEGGGGSVARLRRARGRACSSTSSARSTSCRFSCPSPGTRGPCAPRGSLSTADGTRRSLTRLGSARAAAASGRTLAAPLPRRDRPQLREVAAARAPHESGRAPVRGTKA